MAQMLSPVCTDGLKINQNPSRRLFSKPTTTTVTTSAWRVSKRRRSLLGKRVKVATDGSLSTDTVADDYYTVLGLLPDATPGQIKKAYYNCMKACHPDLSGDDPDTTNFCMFINEVYEVLSDPVQRMIYDEIHGYALTATNPFLEDSKAKDHVFVDEFSCIGCKNCANIAGDVFSIEEDFGRARAYCQSGARDLVQQAIDSCPVDCIHWTSAAQLSLLEDEMRRVERVNASSRWEKRQAKVLAQAKMRMTKQKDPSKAESYWDNLWGKPNEYKSSEEEVEERAKRAAAAARRWREYSRRGVDKPPTFKLPEAKSNKD